MNILFNSLAKNQRLISHLSNILLRGQVIRYSAVRCSHSENEDTFGIGSKYAELDSKTKRINVHSNDSGKEKFEDNFGTLSETLEDP